MRRRTFLKGMAGIAGGVVLGGCKKNDRATPAGTRPLLRVAEWTALGFPSPFAYAAGPGYWRMSLLFDTLLWPDSTGEQLPWLASAYRRSEDGLVYSVDLREAAWKDGRPLTARDVAFTYQYYTSQVFSPLVIGVPPPGVEVVPMGERSVEFRLRRPNATFVQQVLGTMPIVPEHVWSRITDPMGAFGPETLMGTGAYSLASRNEAEESEAYDAHDRFFLGTPFVRRIEMRPVANEDSLTALRVGELDGAASSAEGVRNEVLAPFRDNPEYGLINREAGFGFPLFFNISKGGALADPRFRKACLHAIDRQDMIDRLLTGNGTVGSAGFLPPSHPYYNPAVRDYPFNRAEADRLLDEAGYRRSRPDGPRTNPDRSPLRYTLHLPTVVDIALADLIADNLRAVGIEIDLRRVEVAQLVGLKVAATTYDLLVMSYPGPSGMGPSADPDILRGVYHSNPPNPFHKATGYSNPDLDRLLDAQVATLDVTERKRLVDQIQAVVAEDLPVAMLYYTTFFFAFRKNVFDQWYYTPGGFGPGVPDVYNKHAYITGRMRGIEVRRVGTSS